MEQPDFLNFLADFLDICNFNIITRNATTISIHIIFRGYDLTAPTAVHSSTYIYDVMAYQCF